MEEKIKELIEDLKKEIKYDEDEINKINEVYKPDKEDEVVHNITKAIRGYSNIRFFTGAITTTEDIIDRLEEILESEAKNV